MDRVLSSDTRLTVIATIRTATDRRTMSQNRVLIVFSLSLFHSVRPFAQRSSSPILRGGMQESGKTVVPSFGSASPGGSPALQLPTSGIVPPTPPRAGEEPLARQVSREE